MKRTRYQQAAIDRPCLFGFERSNGIAGPATHITLGGDEWNQWLIAIIAIGEGLPKPAVDIALQELELVQ